MPLPKVSYEDEAREQRRKTLHDVVELAAKFFEATLASRAGARARGYLADRGIDPATQVKFRLGYAPVERFALKEHLGKEGVSVEDMVAAGLLISGDDIPVPFDRFRDRVIFPISDLRGRVIAFGGRTLEKDAQPKYLNSPETPLFHKGATLYNIANARAAAHKGAPGDRGRRLCRRHRDGVGRLRGDGRAARHRADRRAARAAAGRWRTSRCSASTATPPATAPPIGGRYRAAAAQARQEPEIRDAAGRQRSRRSRALGRPRGGGRADRRRAPARRRAVDARDRNRSARHAGAPRRAGSAPRRGHDDDRRRDRAQILPAGLFRARCGVCWRLRARRRAARRRRDGNGAASATGAAAAVGAIASRKAAAASRAGRSRCRSSAARPMWSRARSSRPARCIAAIAPSCRAARR